jgi:hypothetical protein
MTDGTSLERRCAWCDAVAGPDDTKCRACGAALAQRESIGDLVIPGVTAVDPALASLADRPLHIAGPSPTQGAASSAIIGAMIGGPVGLAAVGGVAALGAVEYLAASRGGGAGVQDLESVGKPSEAALQQLAKLEAAEHGPEHRTGDGPGVGSA